MAVLRGLVDRRNICIRPALDILTEKIEIMIFSNRYEHIRWINSQVLLPACFDAFRGAG